MDNQAYETLVGIYGENKVKVHDNGVIEVRNGSDSVYVPTNYNTNNLVSYLPGIGGRGNDETGVQNIVLGGDGNFDFIFSCAAKYYDDNNSMLFANEVASNLGINIENVSLTTFSASGGSGFHTLEEYLETYPNTNANMIVNDGYNIGGSAISNIDTLVDKNVAVTFVLPSNSGRIDSEINYLASKGINVYRLDTDRGNHVTLNRDVLDSQLPQYFIGINEEVSDSNYSNLNACNYHLYKYDPTNPNANAKGYVEISFDDPEFQEDLMTREKGFDSLHFNPTTLSDGTIASDLYKVYNSMNSLSQITTNNSETSNISFTYGDNTAQIPGSLLSAQQGIIGISNGILGNLNVESQLIQEAANVIYKLDNDLANIATTLDAGSDYANRVNETLNTLINTNINTEITIPNFLFNAGGNTVENMGILNASDIKSLYSGGKLTGALAENFNSERENAKTIKSKISDFQSSIGTGKSLCGDLWNQISAKLGTYNELMDKRIESMDKLEQAYIEALKLLDEYMEGYDELDPSKLPEIKEELQSLKDKLEYSKMVVSETRAVTNEKGKITGWEYVYSASARAEASTYIKYANEQIPIIEAFIAKLEGLPEIMSEAEQIINDTLVGMYSDYGVQASNVVTGKTGEYIPPENTKYKSNRISESEFNRSTAMQNTYGTYENYKNHNIINFPEYESKYVTDSMHSSRIKLTEEEYNNSLFPRKMLYKDYEEYVEACNRKMKSLEDFNNDSKLQKTYDNYQDYINGVTKENAGTGTKELEQDLSVPANGAIDANEYAKNFAGTKINNEDTGLDVTTTSDDVVEAPITNESTPSSGTPSSGTPSSRTPSSGTPSSGTPSSGTPSSDTPSSDTPTSDTPSSETPSSETPSSDTPSSDTPTNENEPSTEPTPIEEPVKKDDSNTIPVKEDTNNNKPSSTIPVHKDTTKKNNSSTKVNNNDVDVNAETPIIDDSAIIDVIEPIEEPIIDEPIEEPIIDEPIEEPVVEPIEPIEIKPNEPTIDTTSNSKSNSALKTVGIIAGAGAAIGAAAFGAHTITKARENNESSYYESEEEKQEENYE